jgi:hypothetical protein
MRRSFSKNAKFPELHNCILVCIRRYCNTLTFNDCELKYTMLQGHVLSWIQSACCLCFTIDLEIRLFSNSGFDPISLSVTSYSYLTRWASICLIASFRTSKSSFHSNRKPPLGIDGARERRTYLERTSAAGKSLGDSCLPSTAC